MIAAPNAHYKDSQPSFVIVHDNADGVASENARFLPLEVALIVFNNLTPSDLSRTRIVCKQWLNFCIKSHFEDYKTTNATKVNDYLRSAIRFQLFKHHVSVSTSVGALYCHFSNSGKAYATETKIVTDSKFFTFDHHPSTAAVYAKGSWIIAASGLVYWMHENKTQFINYPPASMKIVELRSAGNLILGLCHDRSALIAICTSPEAMRTIARQKTQITSFEITENNFFIAFDDGSVEIGDCENNPEFNTKVLFEKGNSPVTSMKAAFGKLYIGKEHGQLAVMDLATLKYVRFGQLHKSAVISIVVQDCFLFTLSSGDHSSTVLCHNRLTPCRISQLDLNHRASKIFFGKGILAVARSGQENDFIFFNYNPVEKAEPSKESGKPTSRSFNPVKAIKKLVGRE